MIEPVSFHTLHIPNVLKGPKSRGYYPRMRARGQNGQISPQGTKWTLRYWTDGPTGRVRRRVPLGELEKMTKAEASKEARKFLVKIEEVAVHPSRQMTVGQFWEEVFNADYVTSLKASGKKHYKYIWTHASALAKVPLTELKTEHVQKLCKDKLAGGLSSQTVVHIKNCISAICRYAIEREYLNSRNPCAAVRLPELVKTRESKALTWEEASSLIEGMKKYKHPGWIMVMMGITTSMNVSEIRGLKWGKINLTSDVKIIGVVALPAYSALIDEQNYRGEVGTTKTSNRERIVPLGNETVRALIEWKEHKASLCQHLDSHAVFTSRSGKTYDERNMLEDIKVVGREKGFGWVNWHSLRHSYNTLGSQTEMSIIDRMAGSGHGNMRMSLLYSHSEVERRRRGIEEIERGVSSVRA